MCVFQVLDLSHNRIRELTRDSFSKYTDLKYLYVFENIVMEIEEGTFAQLTGLEALDLSHNGITTIPKELFNLERLRNLYVQGNKLLHLHIELAMVPKPIKAPLQIVNIASAYLMKVPDFGILPDLWQLNISGNPLLEINAEQFSPLCALNSVDFNETQVPNCQCHALSRYLKVRDVTVDNLVCDSVPLGEY